MPIYEFYCSDCNTLFNFFSSKIDTEAKPPCPRCPRRELERRPARFATLKHRGEDEPDPLDALGDDRMEQLMGSLFDEMGDLDEDDADLEEDPRRLAGVMRKFEQSAGLEFGPQMEEFLSRLEAGEDPDRLEEEMDESMDDESMDQFFRLKQSAAAWRRWARRPRVDDTLYFL